MLVILIFLKFKLVLASKSAEDCVNCKITSCFNGGTLVESNVINPCDCPNGYSGPRCQDSLCGKHGKPEDRFIGSGIKCACFKGWRGNFCEFPICRYGRRQAMDGGKYKCVCNDYYTGDLCDTPRCLNGKLVKKTTLLVLTTEECECDPLWEGNFCHLPICTNGHRTGEVCVCNKNYSPPHCESCIAGFSGYKCHHKETPSPAESGGISSKTQLIVAILVPLIFCLSILVAGIAYRKYCRQRDRSDSISSNTSEVAPLQSSPAITGLASRGHAERSSEAAPMRRLVGPTRHRDASPGVAPDEANSTLTPSLPSPPPAYAEISNDRPPSYQEALANSQERIDRVYRI